MTAEKAGRPETKDDGGILKHTHACEFCGRPWDCHNGPACDLEAREGYCGQPCHDHKTLH